MILLEFLKLYPVTLLTVPGTWSEKFVFILKNRVSLWLSLRFRKGCHLTLSCRFTRDISFVATVATLAASIVFCLLLVFHIECSFPDDIRVLQKRYNENSA